MLHINGAQGEGGGQILRTSMALAAICGQPITIDNIRANRSKPGLRPQHLTGVQSMAALCGGTIEGDQKSSSQLTFAPEGLPSGDHTIDIKTAGATSLLLHALYFGMAMAPSGGRLVLCGGTHAEKAPTFDYIQRVWAPMMGLCGFQVDTTLRTCGMYPKGGGEIAATIPGQQEQPAFASDPKFHWTSRPALTGIEIKGLWAAPQEGQPKGRKRRPPRADIAERMATSAHEHLEQSEIASGADIVVETPTVPSRSNGAICSVFLHFGPLVAGFTAWGRRGLPAEDVGATAAAEALAFLQTDACLDEHAADQVLLPLALAGHDASFTTTCLSGHLETNAAIIQLFLPHVSIDFSHQASGALRVDLSSSKP